VFNIPDLVKKAIVALLAPFAAVWPVAVGIADKLNVDLSAGKGAIIAAVAAAGSAFLATAWHLLEQLWDSARGYFPAAPEAVEAVKAAKENTETALKLMRS